MLGVTMKTTAPYVKTLNLQLTRIQNMTKFEIKATCNGKDYNIDFEVPKDIKQEDWDQFSKLLKMACQQMGK